MVENKTEDFGALVETAAQAVVADIERKPVTGADGCWRFDRVIEEVMGKDRDRDFFIAIEKISTTKLTAAGGRRGDWSPLALVCSWASSKAAFATPGFAEARSKWMT